MSELKISKIKKGIVIDHIPAGLGVKLYYYLKLNESPYTVALITNAESKKYVTKDIIKIYNHVHVEFTVLGLIDKNITVSIVENGELIKKELTLPERVENVIFCKNPRCITSTEKQIPHVFELKNTQSEQYSCIYCEEPAKNFEL